MSPEVCCPKCSSTHIVAQRKKSSEGSLSGQILLTCGTGLPANLSADSDIDLSCLKCGFAWNPKRLLEKPGAHLGNTSKTAIRCLILVMLIVAVVFWLTR